MPGLHVRLLSAVLSAALAAGCASSPELDRGRELALTGRTDDALQVLEEGLKRAPDDLQLRAALLRQRELARAQWLAAAEAAAQARRPDDARALYER
ncbi:tetratricopeptide repeat protein, partial [Rhizobacter sp. P5_C2]